MTKTKLYNISINSIVLGLFVILLLLFYPGSSSILTKLMKTNGGIFNVIGLIIGIFVLIIWLNLLFLNQFKAAILLQIIIFPLTNRAQEIFFIEAYSLPVGNFMQKISVTSFMILTTFFIMIFKGKIKKSSYISQKRFGVLLFIYALILTTVQFFNHSIFSSIFLSFGAIWQYLLFYLILYSTITTENDYIHFLKAFIYFSLLNIVFRVLSSGQILFQSTEHNEIFRVGTGALGPAVSYAGYLALFITFIFCLIRLKENIIYLVFGVVIFMELLNTFTRGGLLIIPILLLVVIFKEEKKYILKVFLTICILLIPFIGAIWDYISFRGFSFNLMQIDTVQVRFDIYSLYFSKFFNLSLTGIGIANQTVMMMGTWAAPLHNAYLEILDQGGILSFLFFVSLNILSFSTYIKNTNILNGKLRILTIFMLIALIQWVVFANTTSTSILFYYPYEGTSIFWFLLFSPFILAKINQKKENILFTS